MPINNVQAQILKAIAQHRDPESFVAGGVPINRGGPRFSKDIDIFHDRMERVVEAADLDAATLEKAGFKVVWLRRLPTIIGAEVSKAGETTKLEWVADSDFRFFPAVADMQFGFVLSIADLAINKLMAAVGRREPRDVIDLLTLHDAYLPLGAIAWAAVEVAPGFTPEERINDFTIGADQLAESLRMPGNVEGVCLSHFKIRQRQRFDGEDEPR